MASNSALPLMYTALGILKDPVASNVNHTLLFCLILLIFFLLLFANIMQFNSDVIEGWTIVVCGCSLEQVLNEQNVIPERIL